jgi:hypothetical protein
MDAARKSTLYREVNLMIESMLRQFESDQPAQFLCECRDAGCSRRLALVCMEYEAVRRSGGYLVALDCIADSEVLERADHYAAVAFRSSVTGGETTPSPSASSMQESSLQESSAQESSAQESSARESSPQESSVSGPSRRARSLPARSASGSPSRRGALRLVASAASAQGRSAQARPALTAWSSSLPARSWHRQSQSARLASGVPPLQELQHVAPPRAS